MSKTINVIKNRRTVPESARSKSKEYIRIRKSIKKALETGEKTIPEISRETGLSADVVTFYLMTLRKFHEIQEAGIDDRDEYYYYRLKDAVHE